jgi:hypothetical protein
MAFAVMLNPSSTLSVRVASSLGQGDMSDQETWGRARRLVDGERTTLVTYTGFQTLDGKRFRVFVRMDSEPLLEVQRSAKRAVFTLLRSHVVLRNNRNPLDASHFHSPLAKALLRERDGNVELVMDFKQDVQTEHRFQRRGDGSVTFQVDFPAE